MMEHWKDIATLVPINNEAHFASWTISRSSRFLHQQHHLHSLLCVYIYIDNLLNMCLYYKEYITLHTIDNENANLMMLKRLHTPIAVVHHFHQRP